MNKLVLLRGVNVSGKNKVVMSELKDVLTNKYGEVQTYLNTGNLLFTSEEEHHVVEVAIESIIQRIFGVSVYAICLSYDELVHIVDGYPFAGEKNHYITISKTVFNKDEYLKLTDKLQVDDELELHERWLYFHVPSGYGKTKLTNNLIEKKLGCIATTRNINTLRKLIKKMQ
jgi:uncharacterized protein (DUF1697 family)